MHGIRAKGSGKCLPPAALSPARLSGFVGLYLLFDWLSFVYPLFSLNITPWNPPPGLSLAFLLLMGSAAWWAYLLAMLLAEALVRHLPAPLPYLLLGSVVVTLAYAAAARLLHYWRFNPAFVTLRDVGLLLAVIVPLAALLALLYVSIFVRAGVVDQAEAWPSMVRYWVGDMIGVMIVTPFLLVNVPGLDWRGTGKRWLAVACRGEVLAQMLAIAAVLWLIFVADVLDEFKLFYLLFLPLIWIAMRHGIAGATAALLAIQIGLIVLVQWRGYHDRIVVELQVLLLTLAITGLFLGMAISERQRSQAAMRAREHEFQLALRMAAASETAAALAHELHQPLAAMANYVAACKRLLARENQPAPLLVSTLDKVQGEVSRAGETVHRLRRFFRDGECCPEWLTLPQLLADPLARLQPRLQAAGIILQQHLPADLPCLEVDRMQFETILDNLVNNAVDAVCAAGNPVRQIRLLARLEGPVLALYVCDSGQGVASTLHERLFEPFVSSKAKGMGLGLAISRTLAEANGGTLHLCPEPPEPGCTGACFRLALPAGGIGAAVGYNPQHA